MVLSTRDNTEDVYIVVLDVALNAVRALLFDKEATRVEGYGAQLPRRPDAAADCLDEMHRLVQAAGFPVGAVVGRSESDVTAEDRKYWPAFEGAAWFPALPHGAGVLLGSGGVSRDQIALVMGEASFVGTVSESPVSMEGLSCVAIDDKRWMLSVAVPEASVAYASFRHGIKGSVEKYLENAAADDPFVAALDSAGRRFREAYTLLAGHGPAPQVIACGTALLKSPSLSQRIADAVGASLTLSTEPEPVGRGAALWALVRIGVIHDLGVLPASTGAVFECINLETTK